jgi:tetratricopeptide (TPR) repeat protein
MSSLRLNAYWLALADRDFAGALRRLDADSRKAYSSQRYFLPVDLLRSQIYHLTGRTDECRRMAEKAKTLLENEIKNKPDDGRVQSALGITFALLGRDDEALRAARRGVELMPTSKDALDSLPRIQDLAFVCAMVGRQDEAIERLDILLSSSGAMTTQLLRLDPRWDRLRKNPKFEALLAKHEVRS